MSGRVRPGFIALASAAIVLGCFAAPAAAQTADSAPPLGRLVDVGGRRLHLHCTGSGTPTVVIEAGASAFAIDFALVQPEIAKTSRVCSYDRAGSGWSDARSDVATPLRVVRDLRSLLDTAGEKPPFVLVGASRGGVFVRLFQAEHPGDVAGLVLVDPTAEDQLWVQFQGKVVAITSLAEEQHRAMQSSLPATIPIASRPPQTGAPFDRLPQPLYDTRVALDRRLIASMPPSVSAEVAAESGTGDYTMLARLSRARKATPNLLGDMPLIVLTRGRGSSPDQQAAHAELARMSRVGQHIVVPGAYHEIHLSNPDVVVKAVNDVVVQSRAASK